jgi:hypothetical protein
MVTVSRRIRSNGGSLRNAAIAALLGAFAAGCAASGPPPGPVAAGTVPTVAFESIDGPPVGVFQRLVQNLSAEAEARQIAVVSREGRSHYRVRGYLAAQTARGRTHIGFGTSTTMTACVRCASPARRRADAPAPTRGTSPTKRCCAE